MLDARAGGRRQPRPADRGVIEAPPGVSSGARGLRAVPVHCPPAAGPQRVPTPNPHPCRPSARRRPVVRQAWRRPRTTAAGARGRTRLGRRGPGAGGAARDAVSGPSPRTGADRRRREPASGAGAQAAGPRAQRHRHVRGWHHPRLAPRPRCSPGDRDPRCRPSSPLEHPHLGLSPVAVGRSVLEGKLVGRVGEGSTRREGVARERHVREVDRHRVRAQVGEDDRGVE